MKKTEKKLKGINKIKEKITVIIGTLSTNILLGMSKVYANSNTGSIDSFIDFACDWLTKIGGVVALVGGVMFALRLATRGCRRKE